MLKAELKIGADYIPVPVIEKIPTWRKRGLQETSSGYGNRITTDYMVQYKGRWWRVYCCIFSNSGTLYIGKPGNWIGTVDVWEGV